ncbi:MAG: YfkI [Neobacillus sp.]|nr:YfkI [Neobacillus sp.]
MSKIWSTLAFCRKLKAEYKVEFIGIFIIVAEMNDKNILKGEVKKMGKNLFFKGIFYGALAGGALSLLDKKTRQDMKVNVKKAYEQVSYLVRHPQEITENVKETAEKIRNTIEQVSEDISYITEKVDELRELTPQVKEVVRETKSTFSKHEDTTTVEDLLKEVKVVEEPIEKKE